MRLFKVKELENRPSYLGESSIMAETLFFLSEVSRFAHLRGRSFIDN